MDESPQKKSQSTGLCFRVSGFLAAHFLVHVFWSFALFAVVVKRVVVLPFVIPLLLTLVGSFASRSFSFSPITCRSFPFLSLRTLYRGGLHSAGRRAQRQTRSGQTKRDPPGRGQKEQSRRREVAFWGLGGVSICATYRLGSDLTAILFGRLLG